MTNLPEGHSIAELAANIRDATLFLTARGYTLDRLILLTGLTDTVPLHRNSILKIRWLRPRDPEDGVGTPWIWNPQMDTIAKLENVVDEAIRLGYRMVPARMTRKRRLALAAAGPKPAKKPPVKAPPAKAPPSKTAPPAKKPPPRRRSAAAAVGASAAA